MTPPPDMASSTGTDPRRQAALAGGAWPVASAGLGARTFPQARARRRARRLAGRPWLSCLAADVLMLGLAVAADVAGSAHAQASITPLAWTAVFVAMVVLGLYLRGLYSYRLHAAPIDELGPVLAATAIAAVTVLAARVLSGPDEAAGTEMVRLWAFASAYLACGRVGLALARRRASRQGEGISTLIVGAGQVGQLVAQRLLDRPELGLRPIGFLDKEPLAPNDLPVPLLGASWDLDEAIQIHQVRHVVIAFSLAPHDVLLKMVRSCREHGVEVSLVPRLFEGVTERVSVEHLGGIALLRVQEADPRGWQFAIKYALDRVLALLFVVALAPVLAALAVAVRLSSPGPILYRQRRIGLDGREFNVLKFRSMTGDAGAHGEANAAWAARALGNGEEVEPSPDRTTRLGRVLRSTSLDELPQLFNVVRGDMSLIGPRPESSDFARAFEQHFHRYGDRHRVKSGLTGWAQIHGLRGDTSLADRTEWDNYYIENWSLWLDLKILFLTLPAIIAHRRST